ncbi:MAG: DNA-3-methyladenine glycosylase 2 family protein [Oscillospiraceae bacterium]|jgi:N-glycosylase/DNA lyase|nr:DNA-3-methyladenine glycosylase 2 family protein [Oscillospiraceae bacterium]
MKVLGLTGNFSLKNTLECGQCFRWWRGTDGFFCGVVDGRSVRVAQHGQELLFEEADAGWDDKFWRNYLALDEDYNDIEARLQRVPILNAAYNLLPGVRILRQDVWEVLISFIVSQNNNIKRIKGIISRLCQLAGTRLVFDAYAFPTPGQLAAFDIVSLKDIGCGFRARYLLAATRMVLAGEINLQKLASEQNEQVMITLQQIPGVGPKVAACVLLFGLGRLDVAPVDVWIKRGLQRFFPAGWPQELAGIEGVAQQYLYHYQRMNLA